MTDRTEARWRAIAEGYREELAECEKRLAECEKQLAGWMLITPVAHTPGMVVAPNQVLWRYSADGVTSDGSWECRRHGIYEQPDGSWYCPGTGERWTREEWAARKADGWAEGTLCL